MSKTNKPTGLKITRNGNKFTFSWKIGDKNYGDGQEIKWFINGKEIKPALSIGKKATEAVVNLASYSGKNLLNSYYPSSGKPTMKNISFQVRGNRDSYKHKKKTINPSWSDWAEKKYTFEVPRNATVTKSYDEQSPTVCSFSWNVAVSDDEKKYFRNVKWQTIVVAKGQTAKWDSSNPKWQEGTGSYSGSKQLTDSDLDFTGDYSYTRYFRVIARGVAGNSEKWVQSKHVYAKPKPVFNVEADASGDTNRLDGITIQTKYSFSNTATKPIDQLIEQYYIGVPNAGMECSAESESDWKTIRTIVPKGSSAANMPTIDDYIDEDEVMFFRVLAKHNESPEPCDPVIVKGGVGKLSTPTNVSVTPDPSTFTATVTAKNESSVVDSYLVVVYKTESDPVGFVVGTSTTGSGNKSISCQCPDWSEEPSKGFEVYAVVGDVDNPDMVSDRESNGGLVPQAPASADVTNLGNGTVKATWEWSWADADAAELSWSDHADAWESTDEPKTYIVPRSHVASWNIVDLETGVKWYFRIRLLKTLEDGYTYGEYSETMDIDLSSAPAIPVLTLSSPVITADGEVTCYWGYVSTDGTSQASAEICEVQDYTYGGSVEYIYGEPFANTETAQHITISAEEMGWTSGFTHLLAVRVGSASLNKSEWSVPVPVVVAEAIEAEITQTSLVTQTITEAGNTRTALCLTELPMTVTATGAGDGGRTTIAIERASSYYMMRPDESEFDGHEGETIALMEVDGEQQVTITKDDLIGSLDDGASYRIVATAKDSYGQTAETSTVTKNGTDYEEFEVHWSHQAVEPVATATVSSDVVIIDLEEPEDTQSWSFDTDDRCDIYRLSADKPELIYKDAVMGESYVDPYPTIGESGGHRIVYRTSNGDYTVEDGTIAWLDLDVDDDDIYESDYTIIDFGGERVELYYNVDVSHQWQKDFQQTSYLGGHVQGDWNPAVLRSASIGAITITLIEQDTIDAMRDLASYTGICNVRTKDGSNFKADVQVSEERNHEHFGTRATFSLTINRVDAQGLDGLTYAEWHGAEGATGAT